MAILFCLWPVAKSHVASLVVTQHCCGKGSTEAVLHATEESGEVQVAWTEIHGASTRREADTLMDVKEGEGDSSGEVGTRRNI